MTIHPSKKIHMPKTLYTEIEKLVNQPETSYKTVAEVCRSAGEMLIEHYQLR